jgi:hypothetical protein
VGYNNSTSGGGFGVGGSSASPTGIGVAGANTATSGQATGVQGSTLSPTGIGVVGVATAPGGNGIAGYNTSTTGNGIGVIGASNSPTGIAVKGGNTAGGLAGLFQGNVTVSGNLNISGKLTKGSGSFKIDHPLDPANKYLSHSFVESPDMMNVYNGNITTDRHGLATVILPEYFGAINRDFRYQLTVIGQFAQAIVKQEIENNRFTIRTNKPSVKVSWQVTGVRQDAYAEANRIQVEEDKSASERGHYLHPELFGATEKEAIGATSPPTMTLSAPAAVTNQANLALEKR